MIRWLRNQWHRCLREIDLQILWPACVEQAVNLDQAKMNTLEAP
jgi:hypothetical protein